MRFLTYNLIPPVNFMASREPRQNAFLKLIGGSYAAIEHSYSLVTTNETMIGRESDCQIILSECGMISRRHATVRPSRSPDGGYSFLLCDLGSANGTFLNGQRLSGCQELQSGDRIIFGNDGPQFVFEYALVAKTASTVPPSASNPDRVSYTALFPVIPEFKNLTRKAYLIPGTITVVFVVLMFATLGKPQTVAFNLFLIGLYMAAAAYYFIYRLCGKEKPWWVIISTAILMMLILSTPLSHPFFVVFRQILPGNISPENTNASFLTLLVHLFFGAGLLEELLKALPVFTAYFLGRLLKSPLRERIGVWEPLDGILLGAASALGFTLLETFGQYVPQAINSVGQQAGSGAGVLVGLQLLIPRILGSVSGHMAYSGYFGYFIGLSIIRPRQRWQIIGIGYLTAAILHTLWDAAAGLSIWLLVIVGVLSYAFLMAAILKARTLSPTRSQNFATRLE